MSSIGRGITEARKAIGMNQVELAAALGKAQATVSGWERGHHFPSLADVEALARILGVTSAQLLAEPAPVQQSAPLTIAVVPVLQNLLLDNPFAASNVSGYLPYPPESDPRGIYAHILQTGLEDGSQEEGDMLYLNPRAALSVGTRILCEKNGLLLVRIFEGAGSLMDVRVIAPMAGFFRPA